MTTDLRLGTRASALALWQTNWVVEQLRRLYPDVDVEVVPIKTLGDAAWAEPLSQLGKGVFVNEIEQALLRCEIDLAVHSLKDLPTEQPQGLAIAAVPPREDARDALVSRLGASLATLPRGASVGTSSPRRAAQLLAARPDLRVGSLRGNLDTRLRKAVIDFDAIVVAVAGLLRLGMAGRITEILPVEVCTPAVGQGALAIETRATDDSVYALLQPLDDGPTRTAVAAERALLQRLGGGCHVPVGAIAQVSGALLTLQAVVAHASGNPCLRDTLSGDAADPAALGYRLAEALIAAGADRLLDAR
ncbi:MAG: hydroxymethylbilane synthase [Chloroflexi bacterium]|nr:hydroxymethylbilane synthase [Chloroflexota bacterium]MCL5109684.1 hydroxymethylbilane synthase [Chloroflexota bacterium]